MIPPYQNPDERGHENKALTWDQHPWITFPDNNQIEYCSSNPLQFREEGYLKQPNGIINKLTKTKIVSLKTTKAHPNSSCKLVNFNHPATKYPVFYYSLLNFRA